MDDLDKLRIDIETMLNEIDIQILFAKADAAIMRIDVAQMRTTDGKYVMAELLATKARLIHSLTLLEDVKETRRKRDVDAPR